MNVALNGLGRVGRSILRRGRSLSWLKIVAVNDIVPDIHNIAYGLNYDSLYGPSLEKFVVQDSDLLCGDSRIRVLCESDISVPKWQDLGVDVLIDSSGIRGNLARLNSLTKSKSINRSLTTSLVAEADLVMTLGCNESAFRAPRHKVLSSNTCDATAIGPVLKALESSIGLEDVSIAVIHPWLNAQSLLDTYAPKDSSNDYHMGRAAEGNIIAKTTSVESALRAVLPEMNKSGISALSYRIPTPIVACADISLMFKRATDKEEVLRALTEFQSKSQWNLISISNEPLVSSDFKGNDFSAVIQKELLSVRGRHGKITLWYDNEAGYASRVLDLTRFCVNA